MNVSIIICTRDRADSLRETLRSIGQCEVTADLAAELLVVDNGSSDRTRQTVESTQLDNMPVRYIHEPRTGLCRARNRGLAEVNSDIFLFTDDDVRVPTDWIERMCRPIACGAADAVAGGVKIAPALERDWLRGFVRIWLASTADMVGQQDLQLIGANMAFSRRVLEKVPSFDTELGAGALGFADETLFSWQIVRAGYKLIDNLRAEVEHHFDAARLTREAFLAMAERMGRSNAYVQYHWEHQRLRNPRLLELWYLGKLKLRTALTNTSKGTTSPKPWELSYTSKIHFARQYMRESRRPHNYQKHGLRKVQPACGLGLANRAEAAAC